MSAKTQHCTGWLRILCAVALLSLGFAHKAPQSFAAQTQSAAYQLPDGSFADLCVADTGVAHVADRGDCDACRLAGAILLPEPSMAWLRTDYSSSIALAPASSMPLAGYAPAQPRSRGPPIFA